MESSLARNSAFAAVLLLAHATEVNAADGVIEINQAKALAGAINGVPAEDPAGFPVRITRAGSYRLTSDLTVDQDTVAIQIDAEDVAIDLAGFGIHGPNVCSGGGAVQVTCAFLTSGRGVSASAAYTGVSVRNGIVEGMGGSGIYLQGDGARVEDLLVRDNGGYGVNATGGEARVERVTVTRSQWGIAAGSRAVVLHSIVRDSNFGIYTGESSLVAESSVSGNPTAGINVGAHSIVRSNVVEGNGANSTGGHGVVSGVPSTVSDNQISDNYACGVLFQGGVAGRTGALSGNSLIGNSPTGICTMVGGQRQFSGYAMATSCNVITCASGTLLLGTFCPPNTISCGLP